MFELLTANQQIRPIYLVNYVRFIMVKIKVKQSHYMPEQALRFPGSWGSWITRHQHTKVIRLSAVLNGRLYPQEIFLVLISVRSWVKPGDIVRPEGLCHCKIPTTPSGIVPATFQIVAQCLNQLPHRVPQGSLRNGQIPRSDFAIQFNVSVFSTVVCNKAGNCYGNFERRIRVLDPLFPEKALFDRAG